jgi:hypothetical protein
MAGDQGDRRAPFMDADSAGPARSQQGQVPEKGVGALVAKGFLSWSGPHELQP